ncbi:conserved hypothetical protein [Hyella patelloides LEGE 07179]|uniref:Uncharacterized protein n=1 Tax=Hyella patelloides LEGE 07179 TaxID=945734 RepID=A0A563VYG3_9CYAN|nr:tetratricopeptide repeat protein [Hyella patelloides]VEP16460.1 conserved hypothetical protein [Hyella patelloides LEGE 07179]
MDRKKIQRLLIVVFGLAFIGSTGFAIIGSLFRRDTVTENYAATTEATSATEQLQAQAQGYAKVLEREPENTTALMGLLQASLQTGDLETAIAPLKKLIELYPERTELNTLLTEIETELKQQPEQTTTEPNTEVPE